MTYFQSSDPVHGVGVGSDWQQTLFKQLRICHTMLIICTEAWIDSEWCFAEAVAALAYQKKIIPIRFPDIPDEKFRLSIIEKVQAEQVDDWDVSDQVVLDILKRKGYSQQPSGDHNKLLTPWPGLRAYNEDEAGLFFGRDMEIADCMQMLHSICLDRQTGSLIVHGDSGVGKSSLIEAGILPELRSSDDFNLLVPRIGPESAEIDINGLATALDCTPSENMDMDTLVQGLQSKSHNLNRTTVIIFDQFEQFFAASKVADRDSTVLDFVRHCLKDTSADFPMVIVIGIRSDFFNRLFVEEVVPRSTSKTITIRPLDLNDMREFIVEPARVLGVEIDSELLEALLDHAKKGETLPLISHALNILWARFKNSKQDKHTLKLNNFKQWIEGGLGGLLHREAEAVTEKYKKETLRGLRHYLTGSLVRINDEGRIVKQLALPPEDPEIEKIVKDLVKNRLLAHRTGGYEVMHELLFQEWKSLKTWIKKDQDLYLDWYAFQASALRFKKAREDSHAS